jgi:Domain of unknown function DUF29
LDFATLYEDDIETWAELQVEALRRLAVMPGPWANRIDWENVIEEIEDVGSNQRRAVESLLEQAFIHVLKIAGDPDSLSVKRWEKEVQTFWRQAQERADRAMRSRIDRDKLWRRACKQASNTLEAYDRELPKVSQACLYTFDDVLDRKHDPLFDLRFVVTPKTARP